MCFLLSTAPANSLTGRVRQRSGNQLDHFPPSTPDNNKYHRPVTHSSQLISQHGNQPTNQMLAMPTASQSKQKMFSIRHQYSAQPCSLKPVLPTYHRKLACQVTRYQDAHICLPQSGSQTIDNSLN